jgi:hypothetical protein
MRKLTLILPLFLLFSSVPVVFIDTGTTVHNLTTNPEDLQVISFILDEVELTLTTPFLPNSQVILPGPGDPVLAATMVQHSPIFKALTITALPFGTKAPTERFPTIEPGKASAYKQAVIAYRNEQGAKIQDGPTALLFEQEIDGIISTLDLYISVHHPSQVQITEWIVESADRLWILRLACEMPVSDSRSNTANIPFGDPGSIWWSGIELSSPNPDILREKNNFSKDLADTASLPISVTGNDLPIPPWWDGECDTYTYHAQTGYWAYPLGGSYRGLKACGPRPWADGAPNALVHFFPGSWGALEWECVELSMRFLYLAYGVPPYQANGNQVVPNYSGDQLVKIDNGTPGFAPMPNDVVSSGPETTWGHTFLVVESNVDEQGDGSITILEQNGSSNGLRTLTVNDWVVISNTTVIGWLHDPSGDLVRLYFPMIRLH